MAALPKRYSSAELSGRWPKIPARTLRDIFQKAGLESKGGYDANQAADAVIDYLAIQRSAIDEKAASDRARKAREEADSVALDNAEKRGDIRKRLEAVVNNYAVEVRKTTAGASYIPIEHRKRLTKEFAEIKVVPAAGKK